MRSLNSAYYTTFGELVISYRIGLYHQHCKGIHKSCNNPNYVHPSGMDKAYILNKLIDIYADGNKSRFAQMMGTTPQNIGNWIRRGTIPYEEIYKICVGVNPHWLLTGQGEVLMSHTPQSNPPQDAAPAQLTGIIQELMNELRQKNEEIGELRERIGRADGTIESLQRELNRHAKSAGDVTLEESARAV